MVVRTLVKEFKIVEGTLENGQIFIEIADKLGN